jgi:hypothetical protein
MPVTDPPRKKIHGVMYVPQGRVRTYQPETSWRIFAAAVLLLSAIVNIAWGIVGLVENFYVGDSLTAAHPEAWGWIWILFGTSEIIIATLVLAGSPIGLVLAAVLALLNLGLHVTGFSSVHSSWTVVAALADVLVVYAVLMPWYRAPSTR